MKLNALLLTTLLTTSAAATPAYLGVVNKADGTASFINLETYKTDFFVTAGYLPHEMGGSPDGTHAYVSNYGKDHVRSESPLNKPGNTLTLVDMLAQKTGKEIDLGVEPCGPHGIHSSADGKRLYVTCEERQEIVVVDAERKQMLHSISTGQKQSHMVVADAAEKRAYVTSVGPGTVTVLDLKNKNIVKIIFTAPGTEGISLAPAEDFVYASSVLENTVFKIDTKTLQVVQTGTTDRSPVRVLVTPDGQRLVINNSADGTVQVFDAASMTLIKRIKVGRQPIGIVVPDNHRAYVANMRDNTVSVIDLDKLEVMQDISTGKKPDGLAFIPAAH